MQEELKGCRAEFVAEGARCPDCDGISGKSCYCEPKAAQGIDHAKRAEGEFELFARHIGGLTVDDSDVAFAREIWAAAWQARGQQAGGAEDGVILKHALDALTAHFDEFIGECMSGAPSAKAIARARACLPAKCVNAFKKEKP